MVCGCYNLLSQNINDASCTLQLHGNVTSQRQMRLVWTFTFLDVTRLVVTRVHRSYVYPRHIWSVPASLIPVVQSPYESVTILFILLIDGCTNCSVTIEWSWISDPSNYMSGSDRQGVFPHGHTCSVAIYHLLVALNNLFCYITSQHRSSSQFAR
jgi:hypothetical protein